MMHLTTGYLTTGWRNLLRHKTFATINIVGMAMGIACCILIILFIQDELRYASYHTHSDRIYRVIREMRLPDGSTDLTGGSSGAIRALALEHIPGVERAVRGLRWGSSVGCNGKWLHGVFTLTDPDLPGMFDISLVRGSAREALSEPYSMLLSQEVARAFFGDDDAIGHIATASHDAFRGEYTITGVMAHQPEYAFFRPDFMTTTLSSLAGYRYSNCWTSWDHGNRPPFENWFLLEEGRSPQDVAARLTDLAAGNIKARGADVRYHLQALDREYLYRWSDFGGPGGPMAYIRQLAALGALVLLIACGNCVNLATARSQRRARETGIRKVIGGSRAQLAQQFLGEAALLVVVSLGLAVALAWLALPQLNELTGKHLALADADPQSVAAVGILTISAALLAGAWPAISLSAHSPIDVLGKGSAPRRAKGAARSALVIFQFAACVVLVATATVVYRQMEYIRSRDLGYETRDTVVIPLLLLDRELREPARSDEMKKAFLAHPDVIAVSACWPDPTWEPNYRLVPSAGAHRTDINIEVLSADTDFLETFGVELVAGRNFTEGPELRAPLLINETAAGMLGWDDPIGKRLDPWPDMDGQIIGVVRDFHTLSLHHSVAPLAIHPGNSAMMLGVRVAPGKLPQTIPHLRGIWHDLVPEHPLPLRFVQEKLEERYREEHRLAVACIVFAGLSVLVGVLGLVGLSAHSAERRTREVGIRRVLGAGVTRILILLGSDCARAIALANLIGWPLAWYVSSCWLERFAYRIDIGYQIPLLCGIAVLCVALLAVVSQSLRAALASPAQSLRSE